VMPALPPPLMRRGVPEVGSSVSATVNSAAHARAAWRSPSAAGDRLAVVPGGGLHQRLAEPLGDAAMIRAGSAGWSAARLVQRRVAADIDRAGRRIDASSALPRVGSQFQRRGASTAAARVKCTQGLWVPSVRFLLNWQDDEHGRF
jgi:hypothetical protein